MICVKLFGGLGNQMFQYAFGKSLSCRLNSSLFFDISFFNIKSYNTTKRLFELKIFDINLSCVEEAELPIFKPILLRIVNTIFYKIGLNGIQTSRYFIENKIGYIASTHKIKNYCYLSGYWQSFKYFQDIENIIREDFRFPEIKDERNLIIVSQIIVENSVSIHVRRGDFIDQSLTNVHASCSIDYYNDAINFINKHISSGRFFVFSDDISWAMNNLVLPPNSVPVTGNTGENSFIDMQLMSLCKHNIIANSSFSWWGAWLNNNSNKIVIAPKLWYRDTHMNDHTIDLIPKEWIRI